ncbi:YeiH family protein [Dethiobacter alkaliphilus]|uniref:YeiH family protein n=1 Tax=Dethiobacter alkaliphilus TaxID=427926 RepID=UPI0022264265|nr:YeiH family protein [Dethiobacter alkaliphilus]MCW3491254.1 YeiH family protein [Dethiobacter alkaliphilus]
MSQVEEKRSGWKKLINLEDWWAVWLGLIVIVAVVAGRLTSPVLPGRWGQNGNGILSAIPPEMLTGILITGVVSFVVFAIAVYFYGRKSLGQFMVAFPMVFVLAIAAELLGGYEPLRHYGINNVIWALLLGLIISNTIQTPQVIKAAVRTELYIKTGLVLLGTSILFNRMLALGALGLGVAWMVTPIVLVFMYWFSQKYLKMQEQRGLAIAVASATSVCGVSAAIAAGTAAKAKKEEISLAISVTLIFTIIMMVAMPAVIRLAGIPDVVGGAWLGGTIDATGAVVASASMLSEQAVEIASVIKMIQNILIGVIAFAIAVVWVSVDSKGVATTEKAKVSPMEIWNRLPKFIIGFVLASLVFSFVLPDATVSQASGAINGFRNFFFTLAFVSIGLESNFKKMAALVKGGSPVVLYLVGQTMNLGLTLLAAYIFFSGRFFPLPF